MTTEKKVIERILRSLPQKFELIVEVIEEMRDTLHLTRYEVFSSLQAHKDRINDYSSQPLE